MCHSSHTLTKWMRTLQEKMWLNTKQEKGKEDVYPCSETVTQDLYRG
jgi:hypothetical protein